MLFETLVEIKNWNHCIGLYDDNCKKFLLFMFCNFNDLTISRLIAMLSSGCSCKSKHCVNIIQHYSTNSIIEECSRFPCWDSCNRYVFNIWVSIDYCKASNCCGISLIKRTVYVTLGEPSIVDLYVQFTKVPVILFCQTWMWYPVFVAENLNTEIVTKSL